VFDAREIYTGPYLGNGFDLVAGYNSGYRASWDGATGKVGGAVIEDNTRAWSGDHCVDPREVPGVLFTSEKIEAESAHIMDIAPTALAYFGIAAPRYMDGRSLIGEM
jgi:predicted AlkP superfamily phosphohydrolase/phosphomutase